METPFSKLLWRFIQRHERFLLSGHVRPDGDSIGACACMDAILTAMGKEVRILCDPKPSFVEELGVQGHFVPDDLGLKEIRKAFATGDDFAFLMLDCAQASRTGRGEGALLMAKESMAIDHHVSSEDLNEASFTYVDANASSCCEILYRLLDELEIALPMEAARALFIGICFDTGGFRHSNTSWETFQIASELTRLGVDNSRIMNAIFYSKSFRELKALGLALEKANLLEEDILITGVTLAEFEERGLSHHDAEGVIGILTEVKDADTVIFLRQVDADQVRVNMRSKGKIDVSRIAANFGGGGHRLAAGCTLKVSQENACLEEAKSMLLPLLQRALLP